MPGTSCWGGLGRKGNYRTKALQGRLGKLHLRPCPFLLSHHKVPGVGRSNAIDSRQYVTATLHSSYRTDRRRKIPAVWYRYACRSFRFFHAYFQPFHIYVRTVVSDFRNGRAIFISTSPGDVRHSLVLVRAASRVIPCRCVSRLAIRNALIYFPGGIP